MKVEVLVENTTEQDNLAQEHGLSLYIETGDYKILFDTGKSDAFLRNSQKMGVDLGSVNLGVLSHGHYDHGGGLPYFFEVNDQAIVYCHTKAFGTYLSKRGNTYKYIGLDQEIPMNHRFHFIHENLQIGKNIWLFIADSKFDRRPILNRYLCQEVEDRIFMDDFNHEINLVIKEDKDFYLFAGCAHKGILPIMESFVQCFGVAPTKVFGGFHLSSGSLDLTESPRKIEALGRSLMFYDTEYATCHCTGELPYAMLKELMGDRIDYIGTGRKIQV